jgi:hypothetical protein
VGIVKASQVPLYSLQGALLDAAIPTSQAVVTFMDSEGRETKELLHMRLPFRRRSPRKGEWPSLIRPVEKVFRASLIAVEYKNKFIIIKNRYEEANITGSA